MQLAHQTVYVLSICTPLRAAGAQELGALQELQGATELEYNGDSWCTENTQMICMREAAA
jgi:hypothetical protein